MLIYDMGDGAEAFSTTIDAPLDFDVVMPIRQDHTTLVTKIPDESERLTGVDALITDMPGVRIGVRTADCVPILIYAEDVKAIAAIHSGWKGTLGNIISAAIGRLKQEYGADPAAMRAVIGPCIHVDAYEVGDDLYERFIQAGYREFCSLRKGPEEPYAEKWHIDLPGICASQLEREGVKCIEVRSECTYTQHDRFYSARWYKGALGLHRILNCIQLLP